MITIDDYFERNGIEFKNMSSATPNLFAVDRHWGTDTYFNHYFKEGLEEFIDCLDFFPNKKSFDILATEAKKYQDVFEPCSQSGILGCYLALNMDGKYTGMDINPIGVQKARKRAVHNSVSQNVFQLDNLDDYAGQHEAIIGRYVANDIASLAIDAERVEWISRTAPNVVLLSICQDFARGRMPSLYIEAFEKHGYVAEVTDVIGEMPSTGAHSFILKAKK